MADNDQYDDEYQFADLDTANPEPVDEGDSYSTTGTTKTRPVLTDSNVKRNAIIAVALIILAMVIYKFLGSYFAGKKDTVQTTQKQVQAVQTTPTPPPSIPVQPIQAPQPVAVSSQIEQKLSTVEVGQQTLRTDVSSIGNQLEGISANVSQMTNQIAQLNQMIANLSSKMDEQSMEIERLRAYAKPKKVHKVVRRVIKPMAKYFIQALIPGRAWLISSNGTTLTVREGSTIPGYGVVKLIDPHQGRVTTSSGQVIRFSQSDS